MSGLAHFTDAELEEQKARTLRGLRAIFLEEERRERARQGKIEKASAIPEKGAAEARR